MIEYFRVGSFDSWEVLDVPLASLASPLPEFAAPVYPVLVTDDLWRNDWSSLLSLCEALTRDLYEQIIIAGKALDIVHDLIHENLANSYARTGRLRNLYTVIMREPAVYDILWHALYTYPPLNGDRNAKAFIIFIHLSERPVVEELQKALRMILAEK